MSPQSFIHLCRRPRFLNALAYFPTPPTHHSPPPPFLRLRYPPPLLLPRGGGAPDDPGGRGECPRCPPGVRRARAPFKTTGMPRGVVRAWIQGARVGSPLEPRGIHRCAGQGVYQGPVLIPPGHLFIVSPITLILLPQAFSIIFFFFLF